MKKIGILLAVLLMMISMTACGGSGSSAETTVPASVELNMQALCEEVIAMENVPEMLPLDQDMQLNFCGIDAADCRQAVVMICADSLRTDEIWMIEAVDEDALARIRALAENRLTAKAEESITYSPEQYAVVQKAEIITVENYFMLLVSPDVDALAAFVRSAAGM